jgi:opacity protein-like surface antigen
MRTVAACLLALVCASPVVAQSRAASSTVYPAISPRVFVEISEQKFTAQNTFKSVFGQSAGPFKGGGFDVVLARNIFVEVSASQFTKTGQRVFRFESTDYPLGIPLTTRVTPIELIGGVRVRRWSHVIPYGGVGFGSFKYEETSDFATADENIDVKKNGLVVVGGAEFRLFRWVGVTVDAHYSHVTGVLGQGGLSQAYKEDDLGGSAARFRVLVGR